MIKYIWLRGFFDALSLNQNGNKAICVFVKNKMRWRKFFLDYTKDYEPVFISDNNHTFNDVILYLYKQNSQTKTMLIEDYKDINEAYTDKKGEFNEWFNYKTTKSFVRYIADKKLRRFSL